MDGWRGTRLGYAGGRTGYFANYGNSDALRGTLGQNQASTNNFANALRGQQVSQTVVTGLALTGGLLLAYSYRDELKKRLKKMQQAAGM